MGRSQRWIRRAQRAALAGLLIFTTAATGCQSKTDQAGQTVPVAGAPVAATAAVTQSSWAPDALEELLAPIALYPDALVGQILAASVNPQEVLDAGNWLLENQSLTGDALDQATEKAGFGPAMRSLVHFPSVVDMMCQEIDWTKQVGAAFTSDQGAVLDAVQRLRAQAVDVGNLKSSPQQKVESKTENGETVVIVEPADPQIVYVPQYDPQVVYTTPPPAPQVEESKEEGVSTEAAIAGGLLAFGVGMMVGSGMSSSYCYPHWGAGAVYVGPRPFYPPAYAYRPVYGAGFHPAHGYHSPAGYRHSYNNRTNVVINNNDYYNRFDHNGNINRGESRSPIASTKHGAKGNAGGQTSWRGQSSYKGAKDHGTQGRSDRTVAASTPSSRTQTRSTTPQRSDQHAGTRAASTSGRDRATSGQPQRSAQVDRGYGGGTHGVSQAGTGDGTRSASRSAASAPAPAARSAPSATHESALSGASHGGSGSFDRAASARGSASASASSSSRGGSGMSGGRGGGGRR